MVCDRANESDHTSQDEFEDAEFNSSSTESKLFDQHELSDLIRDLNLSKESSELLAS